MPIQLVCDRDTGAPHPLDPRLLGCHTAVLAQSGSGKSFLVGRLIEEILISTKARVVLLDPNSDFVRLPEVDASAWKRPELKPWFFPGDTESGFAALWSQVRPTVLSNRNLAGTRPLRISWGGLTDRERADAMDIEPAVQPELYWSLVLASEIASARWNDDGDADFDFEHFRQAADDLCDFLLGIDAPDDISTSPLAPSLKAAGPKLALHFRSLVHELKEFEIWRPEGEGEEEEATDLAELLSAETAPSSATVVDLLSVDTEAERLALTARTLATVWGQAREGYSSSLRDIEEPDYRVPTFVVIDEAHNIIPVRRASPAAERVAADVIRIAAEGRKFGLFLLLITQRPRKLDPSVLSECDALFLMRMTNDIDLKSAAETFGFLDEKVAARAKELKTGNVFLQGRLGGGATVWHAAPRRTMQGGRSLDDGYWSSPTRKRRSTREE